MIVKETNDIDTLRDWAKAAHTLDIFFIVETNEKSPYRRQKIATTGAPKKYLFKVWCGDAKTTER